MRVNERNLAQSEQTVEHGFHIDGTQASSLVMAAASAWGILSLGPAVGRSSSDD